MRAIRTLLMIGLLASGCVRDGGERPESSHHPSPGAQTAGSIVLRRTIDLPTSHQLGRTRLEVPDPSLYELMVIVRSAPETTVRLWVMTEGGTRLSLVDGSINDDCSVVKGGRVCRARIPALEAQRAGVWRVLARDTSGIGGVAHVVLRFSAVEEGE